MLHNRSIQLSHLHVSSHVFIKTHPLFSRIGCWPSRGPSCQCIGPEKSPLSVIFMQRISILSIYLGRAALPTAMRWVKYISQAGDLISFSGFVLRGLSGLKTSSTETNMILIPMGPRLHSFVPRAMQRSRGVRY